FVMMRRMQESQAGIERRQVGIVLAAFALFVAYNAPAQLARFLGGAAEASGSEAALIAGIMLASVVLLVALAARLVPAAREPGEAGRDARRVLAAMGLAFALAAVSLAASAFAGVELELLGLVRFGSVGLIAYGIARYQLFDLDLRVKHAAAWAGALLAAGVLGFAAWTLLRATAGVGEVAAVLVGLAAAVPLFRVATRLTDRLAPHVSAEGEHLYLRKLDVYRAALEDALRTGKPVDAGDAELAAVRQQLGLGLRDHGVVASLALSRAAPEPMADLRVGGLAFGRYQVRALLGEGGFGRVFLAHDRVLDRDVVVKELQPRWRSEPRIVATFLREAQVAGRLRHPNIVAIHDVREQAGQACIIMEHVPGGTLQDALAPGPLPEAEAVRIARCVLGALAAAHAKGVVHRDVKAGNVLLGPGGEVKLTDFGIAQLASEGQERTASGLTSAGFQPGTLAAMSPEQARGAPVDARSDVYAAGALLHRMLTGQPHVDLAGLDELAARNAIADAHPPAMPAVRADLRATVRRALDPEPSRRFPTARAMADALAHGPQAPVER
ncbi:MAG: serine/threonine protein kinase, partial [Halobacteriales archaeon]|nr:serine/threonine protein kinase [Halobacteriales archaeon]